MSIGNAANEAANDWHVVARTHGGTVSILRNMPLRLARETAMKLRAWENNMRTGIAYEIADGAVVEVHILGPEGWTPDLGDLYL